MFYDNAFYWTDHYGYVLQTKQTFGDTTRFQIRINRIVDSGIVSEGKNRNLEINFLIS